MKAKQKWAENPEPQPDNKRGRLTTLRVSNEAKRRFNCTAIKILLKNYGGFQK